MRPTWVEVDLDAIAHNVSTVAATVAPAEVCAVVKADGYGHGAVPVATTALAAGATRLAVALVEEGVRLRQAGIDAPVLVLSEAAPEDSATVMRWGLTPTVYSESAIAALAAAGAVPVHVKVDTGMHRVGAAPDDIVGLAKTVAASGTMSLEALWTHFAVAEEDHEFTTGQLDVLTATAAALAAAGLAPPRIHAANTAGALGRDDARFSMVRLGLGMYGLRPAPHIGAGIELRPAMKVVSHVTHLRRHPAGTRPSYGRRRLLPSDATVATVPIGYADGVSRRLASLGAEVLIRGRRFPLAGTVTMDQIVVDVDDAEVEVGDQVVLLGRQGDVEISADEWAERLGTISYEVVCGFGARVPRRYRGGAAA